MTTTMTDLLHDNPNFDGPAVPIGKKGHFAGTHILVPRGGLAGVGRGGGRRHGESFGR